MHLRTYLSALALTAAPTYAITIVAYTNRLSCGGGRLTYSANEGECVQFPRDYGTAVEFQSLPLGSIGQTYNGTDCQQGPYDAKYGGLDRTCWMGGDRRAGSATWFTDSNREPMRKRADGVDRGDFPAHCASVLPYAFTYINPNGSERTIRLSANQEAIDLVLDLHDAKDFDGLGEYGDI